MIKLFDTSILKSQYIDASGKCRMVCYNDNELCLMTNPLPPFNLPEKKDISLIDLSSALTFVKEHDLIVIAQDGNKNAIQGLKIGLKIGKSVKDIHKRKVPKKGDHSYFFEGYIPIKISKPLRDVAFYETTEYDPIRTDETKSDLDCFVKRKKIAKYLKNYTLYMYSLNPNTFDKKSFIIDSSHTYNLEKLRKRLYVKDNDIMLKNGKLIVDDKTTRRNLLYYLEISLKNDRNSVLNYKTRNKILNPYQDLTDFEKSNDYHIFLSYDSINEYLISKKRSETRGIILSILDDTRKEPYFVRKFINPITDKKEICIVQNVYNGDFDKSITVGLEWNENKINKGWNFDEKETKSGILYIIYDENEDIVKSSDKKGKVFIPLLQYNNGEYAALLFF